MKDTFTYKEIFQQPSVWLKAYSQMVERKDEISAFMHHYLYP